MPGTIPFSDTNVGFLFPFSFFIVHLLSLWSHVLNVKLTLQAIQIPRRRQFIIVTYLISLFCPWFSFLVFYFQRRVQSNIWSWWLFNWSYKKKKKKLKNWSYLLLPFQTRSFHTKVFLLFQDFELNKRYFFQLSLTSINISLFSTYSTHFLCHFHCVIRQVCKIHATHQV